MVEPTPIGAQVRLLAASLRNSGSLTPHSATDPETAVARAKLLAGCYRKDDAADPETYAAALAAVLAQYPPDIVREVTDPRSGLPSRIQWLPSVKEVRDECEAIDERRRRRTEIAALEERQLRERREALAAQARKPTLEELQAKYGPNWGMKTAVEQSPEAKRRRLAELEHVNRRAFEAECIAAGMPVDSAVSPTLRKLLSVSR